MMLAPRLAIIAFALVALARATGPARAELAIYHFNVGQGDATLLLNQQSGRSLLIDAGNKGRGTKVVAPALKMLGLTEVNYFLATHYDADHIGGFDEIIKAGITVTDAVYDRGDITIRKRKTAKGNDTQYGQYLKAAGAKRQTLTASCEAPIDLGPDIEIAVVAAAGHYLRKPNFGETCPVEKRKIAKSKDNDLSIALRVRYKDFSYFIGGDLTGGGNSTTPMEEFSAPWIDNVDVLKIDHHGSKTSSNQAFLEKLAPEVAIISVGDGGVNLRYGLPKQLVLDRLASLKNRPKVFLTNKGEGGFLPGSYIENRHIILHTNGQAYTINGLQCPVDEMGHLDKKYPRLCHD